MLQVSSALPALPGLCGWLVKVGGGARKEERDWLLVWERAKKREFLNLFKNMKLFFWKKFNWNDTRHVS